MYNMYIPETDCPCIPYPKADCVPMEILVVNYRKTMLLMFCNWVFVFA